MTSNHGGARKGSGRKSLYNEPTKALKVPASRVIEIKNYLSKRNCTPDVASVSLINPTTQMSIPLALEKIAAGFPSPAQDHIEKTMDMNEHLVQNEAATFVVKVASLSMLGAGIDIDDELVVDRSLEAKDQDIVVALIDNDLTVKRLMIDEGETWLKAENPECSDIHLKEHQELIIWGVVTYVLKPFRKRK